MPDQPIEVVHCGECGDDYERAEGHRCDGEPASSSGRNEPRDD